MNATELAKERRRQKRLEAFGTDNPRCGVCGEDDDRVLELHHPAGRKLDDAEVIHCRNCHRKVSDDQRDHPAVDTSADPLLNTVGHFLLGLADMLRIIVEKLREFGSQLIERASKDLEVAR
jgi:hypothetical protein